MKKAISILLIFVMLFGFLPNMGYSQDNVSLIVHYQRPDGEYEGWNLWAWPENGEGKAYPFKYDDDYGVVAIIKLPPASKYGFIVRKGDWEQKDIDEDRFVSIDGEKEIWLTAGEVEVKDSVPSGYSAFDKTKLETTTAVEKVVVAEGETRLRIHYKRYDDNYDGWNLWIWPKGKDGKAYAFDQSTDYGALADLVIAETDNVEEIGFIVRKGEWEAKDVESDRFFTIDMKNEDGIIEVYLLEGTETVFNNLDEMDLSPKFLKAEWLDEVTLRVQTSSPVSVEEISQSLEVKDETGSVIKPKTVKGLTGDPGQRFVMLFDAQADVKHKYTVHFDAFEPIAIQQTALYGTQAFEEAYGYDGDLGAIYEVDQTTFVVWSPVAEKMVLNLYKTGHASDLIESIPMTASEKGTFKTVKKGDMHGVYYTFSVTINGKTLETYDPYASSAGVNGDRSMVIDMARTNPEGWDADRGPSVEKVNDIVVYEVHVRDVSMHENANITHKGKFLGVVESGTKTTDGTKTGLDHFVELGVTHVQILPMYDYNSVDETKLENNVFNWGYDPKNYNVPEGSYSTDPYDGAVRVNELKQMVKGLHDNGLGVIMDVVYNHTALSANSNLSILMPDYYYRMKDGGYSNASGTGNETASEHIMVRKLILDSLIHWVEEYHIDGFRFDLMGVHDIETMKRIESELRKIRPDIVIYGEGWTGGTSTLSESERLVKKNLKSVDTIGAFSDDFRDGVKGHVFNSKEAGFTNGAAGFEESVKFGIVGSTKHAGVNYRKINYSVAPWANYPSQAVNYVSAHDNLTLWDKLLESNPDATDAERKAMLKLSYALVLTSQGMPFLHFGDEFLRTKGGDHNSYKSPDAVNQIDWNWKVTNADAFNYVQGLIKLRKEYSALRLSTQEEIQNQLTFFDTTTASEIVLKSQMIGYKLEDEQPLYLLFNGKTEAQDVVIPSGTYGVLADHENASDAAQRLVGGGTYKMPAHSALVLVKQSSENYKATRPVNTATIVLSAAGLIALAGVAYWLIKRKK